MKISTAKAWIAAMLMVQLDSVLKIPMGVIYLIISITESLHLALLPVQFKDDWNALRRGKKEAEMSLAVFTPIIKVVILAGLLLVTYIPAVSMTLPTLGWLV